MWMGTYPTFAILAVSTAEPFRYVLNANEENPIRKIVLEKYRADLPFLFTVLPNANLPRDAHALATLLLDPLHGQVPSSPNTPRQRCCCKFTLEPPLPGERYCDANHQPVIGVALTSFELFVGFKPLDDIQTLLQLPPLCQFIPSSQTHFSSEALRKVCCDMLTASESNVRSITNGLRKLPKEIYGKHNLTLPSSYQACRATTQTPTTVSLWL
jgi:mannose-6-phosphate isomerase